VAVYVGFDCSTQSLSVVAIDSDARQVIYRDSRPFDSPFVIGSDPAIVHASPRMWVDALGEMLDVIGRQLDPTALAALSGSAQQHGSVYCGGTPDVLTRATAPIWMDSSTQSECDEIEAAVGGPSQLAQLTGSRAYPRFTGPQIRKFAREEPDAYLQTRQIHLVSSYLASVLCGEHVAIDHGDASGMNLMDIRSLEWSPAAVGATAPDLLQKLPPLVPSHRQVGTLSQRWRASAALPAVPVIAWSGDNPCSLVGTGLLREGQLAVSLGTSDTIFGPMRDPRVSRDGTGHVFASPLGAYMGITVFRNGSLARERVRNEFGLNWDTFSEALRTTPAGNDGAMMLPWFEPEITPHVQQGAVQRYGLSEASPAQHVRAIVEAQVMALARHSEWMGVVADTIYATGGAAVNQDILQVIADVFDADVYRFDSPDSAALGAALRAFHAHSYLPWDEVVDGFVSPIVTSRVTPVARNVETYGRLRPLYAAREAEALSDDQ
jgi:xylulokinase